MVISWLVNVVAQPFLRNHALVTDQIYAHPDFHPPFPQTALTSRTLFQLVGAVRLSFGQLVRRSTHMCRALADCHLLFPGRGLHLAWQARSCLYL